MKDNDKIYVAKYLHDINEKVKDEIKFNHVKKDYIEFLTCKSLAEKVGVTQATISNLTTHSNFYLLYRISEEILDAYYSYFDYLFFYERKEYPDEIISPKDKYYILSCLVTYYSEEWINY